jgi:hypothetical protein
MIRVFGYLDAGAGSMIVGAVAAGAAGVAVAAKVGWRRVTGVFRKDDDLETADSGAVNATDDAAAAAADGTEAETTTDVG